MHHYIVMAMNQIGNITAGINLLSAIGIFIAYQNYRRKSGINISSSLAFSESITTPDMYVSSISLTNAKDRSIAIYGIYLMTGRNIFIEIESFKNAPFILKAYETNHWTYGPVDHYSHMMTRANVKGLFNHKQARIILSTSEGKCIAKKDNPIWSPSEFSMKNTTINNLHPIACYYAGRRIGGNVRYIIAMKTEDKAIEICDVMDSEITFNGFILSKNDIATQESINRALESYRAQGLFDCDNFEIIDMSEIRSKFPSAASKYVFTPRLAGFWGYHILGRLKFYRKRWYSSSLSRLVRWLPWKRTI